MEELFNQTLLNSSVILFYGSPLSGKGTQSKLLAQWLEQEGLQAIATRVSTGDECSIIIEDGYVAGAENIEIEEKKVEETPKWKACEY